ncbi:MAG: DegV family protein [Actinomycetota bacterium]|nr:DegV family protein [Actinomycetota bacterium]
MPAPVAVVTDSTATLVPELAAAHGITVVPLQIVVGGTAYEEGVEAKPDVIAAALRQFVPVSTSRPAPEAFVRLYDRLLAAGHESCVSVHLSAEVSGTVESAVLAATETSLTVTVVDTRLVGIGTGLAALAAARAATGGADEQQVAAAARAQAAATTSLVYVDTLEHLRRGGRVGTVAALMGAALAVKPLLCLEGGRLVQKEKVRTTARALARIEELVVEAAGALGQVPRTVVVQHLAAPERALDVAERLRTRFAGCAGGVTVEVGEVGAVIGAHVGPGMVAVVVAPAGAPGG